MVRGSASEGGVLMGGTDTSLMVTIEKFLNTTEAERPFSVIFHR